MGDAGARVVARVVIVDDHDLFRAGVRASLGPRVEVVAESGDVEGAVRAIEELEPDVVLLDVHMPGGGGAEVIRRSARAARPFAFSRCRSATRPKT